MSEIDALEWARNMAVTALSAHPTPTDADLDQAVRATAAAAAVVFPDKVDTAELRRMLEAEVSVFQGEGAVLDDDDDRHRPWLDRRRGDIDWRFWEGYRGWISRTLPPGVLGGLDRMTDDVLDRLGDPTDEGPWDRRGMIVGQVQSGKTSNYTGLICKAADAGYKFIVVLAGMHNSLRSQTQHRLDEGFLGLDSRTQVFLGTSRPRAIGVGSGGKNVPPAFTLTSSDEKGDFARAVAGRVAGRVGSDPVLLVVKKNKTILENLILWVTTSNGEVDPDSGRRVVSKFPLLIIDDEADNASVNTKEIEFETDDDGTVLSETDPATINRLIRTLLHSFRRSSLVSYTATPFANIFIDEDRRSPAYGEDLFPRSFIRRMDPPSNYLGPAELFGLAPSAMPGEEAREPLGVLRAVSDNADWLEPGHRKDAAPGRVPGSLREAIRAFILVIAAREARGQIGVHNSMLVHVTRFVDVQAQLTDQIQAEIDNLRDRITYGNDGSGRNLAELKQLWESDFEPTSADVPRDMRGAPVDFEQIRPLLPAAVSRIRVLQVNGSARDALEYADHPDGISVIAVGGDKLSRGLTLEGLSVSYYLRASKMYDSLMQMGRWFGYRPGYADLIRLYTTGELQLWYREITAANEELGAKFDEMARVGSNPRQFALMVRKSPAGLLVTAAAKMRHGRDLDISFSDNAVETISFTRDSQLQARNLTHVDAFLREQSAAGRRSGETSKNPLWEKVPGGEVEEMLSGFVTVPTATKAHAALLARYVADRVANGELTEWTVALVSNGQIPESERETVGGERIGLTTRNRHPKMSPPPDVYAIRSISSQSDELLDLSTQERDRALRLARDAFDRGEVRGARPTRTPSGPYIRQARPVTRGLLVLYCLDPAPARIEVRAVPGFMVSFPASHGAPTVSYRIPRRYWEQEAG